jgi:hypothetical protein
MNKRNKLIITLFTFGVILFTIVQFIIVPKQKAEEERYLSNQLEATTQDLNYIIDYKNQYLVNSSNTINLFHKLPLSVNDMTFEIFEDSTLKVEFKDTFLNVGKKSMENKSVSESSNVEDLDKIYKEEVYKSLIYNSTAAFALIDNLEGITYLFSDVEYRVKEKDIENLYSEFDNILNEDRWEKEVQSPLKNSIYIEANFEKNFIEF